MGRPLDERAIFLGNPKLPGLPQCSMRRFKDERVIIDRPDAMGTTRLSAAAEVRFERLITDQDNGSRASEALGAEGIAFPMSVESAEPLEEDVHRRQVCEYEIRIEVETLLDGLCSYRNGAPDDSGMPEALLDRFIETDPISARKSRVMKGERAVDTEEKRLICWLNELLERSLGGDGVGYRIAEHQHASTEPSGVERASGELRRMVRKGLDDDLHPLGEAGCLNDDRHAGAATRCVMNRRVGNRESRGERASRQMLSCGLDARRSLQSLADHGPESG